MVKRTCFRGAGMSVWGLEPRFVSHQKLQRIWQKRPNSPTKKWIGCVERYFWTSVFLVWLLVRERKCGRNTGKKCICLDVQFTCLGCHTWKFTQIPHLKLCKLSWSNHGWQTRGSEHHWLPNKMNLGRQQFHRFIINQKKSTCKSTRVFDSLFSVAVAPRNAHQESILWFKTRSCSCLGMDPSFTPHRIRFLFIPPNIGIIV